MKIKAKDAELGEYIYEPECVVWADDGGPVTYYDSVEEWGEAMLDEDDVWYGTHNDVVYIAAAMAELKLGHQIHLTWMVDNHDRTYRESKAKFFMTPLYIDCETGDWFYPDEVEVTND